MSIYISGLEFPKVPTVIILLPDGKVEIPSQARMEKAIPVPEHGRLIDADALGTPGTIEEDTLWRGRIETEVYLASTIYNAATIVPADKEGEG